MKENGRIALWTVGGLASLAVLSGGTWAFKVVTSDIKGQGDATRIHNSAQNRIQAQEGFESRYQDILASDRRLDALQAAVTATPSDRVAVTNLAGGISYCIDVVADYNAAARKFTQADFRAIDLPAEIVNTDPTSDCKGN